MSLETIAAAARVRLRDYGVFFETPFTRAAPTLRLPHPLVDAQKITVWHGTTGQIATTGWALDARNGILKFEDPTLWTNGVGVSGYHYEWFLNEDLVYFASVATNYHLYGRTDVASADDFTALEADVVSSGTVVQALWSLASELATDIDVTTPEGMHIPASERFQQVWTLLQSWIQKYEHQAQMLGVGLDRIEMFTLRRLSKTTGRLVPVYRPREFGDARWPERIYPQVDPHAQVGDSVTVTNELDVSSTAWQGW